MESFTILRIPQGNGLKDYFIVIVKNSQGKKRVIAYCDTRSKARNLIKAHKANA